MPPGSHIGYRADDVIDFPVGTTISKTFYYARDPKTPGGWLKSSAAPSGESIDLSRHQLVETRILQKEADGNWLAYGMRGNAFMSHDGHAPWTRSALQVPASFFNHAVLPDGKLMLVGQGSLIATSDDGGNSFSVSRAKGRATLTDLQVAEDGSGWITSDAGLQALAQAAPAKPTSDAGATR